MTGNYVERDRYQAYLQDLVFEMTGGTLDPGMVERALITYEGTVFVVFYYDREGHKIAIPEGEDDWYCPTYYYRVKPVDATISW